MPKRNEGEEVKKPPVQKALPVQKNAVKSVAVSEKDATISYEISITKSTGNYEFIKLTAGVVVPLDAPDEMLARVDDGLVIVRDRIIQRLEEDLKSVNI